MAARISVVCSLAVAVAGMLAACDACDTTERVRILSRMWPSDAAYEAPEEAAGGPWMSVFPPGPYADTIINVTVAWGRVANPASSDWVGYFCPSDATVAPDDTIDWFYVNTLPAWQSGNGAMVVTLYNARCVGQFRYYRDPSPYQLVVASAPVSWSGDQPLHTRISLASDAASMNVMWITNASYTDNIPRVAYGTSPDALTLTAVGTSSTYEAADMCGAPATWVGPLFFVYPGMQHHVVLTGLAPATSYFYHVGGNGGEWGPVRQFTTAPLAGPNVPVQFVAYGDMGISSAPGAVSTADRVGMMVDDLDFVAHIGDLSYARGTGIIWDVFGDLVEPIAAQLPYMVCIGNHEYDHLSGGAQDPSGAPGVGFHPSWGNYGDDSNGECAVPVVNRFSTPNNGHSVFWYSYNYGSVHFVMMSTEHNYTAGSPQYEWLQQDLAAVDRSTTPWVILGGHRPMYTSEEYQGDYQVSIHMQQAFEDLLLKYQVNLALWGHYHAYQRSCPVYREECTKGAPTHIVVGSAGASLDNVGLYNVTWRSAYFTESFGFLRVNVHDQHSMYLAFIENTNGTVVDEVWITQ